MIRSSWVHPASPSQGLAAPPSEPFAPTGKLSHLRLARCGTDNHGSHGVGGEVAAGCVGREGHASPKLQLWTGMPAAVSAALALSADAVSPSTFTNVLVSSLSQGISTPARAQSGRPVGPSGKESRPKRNDTSGEAHAVPSPGLDISEGLPALLKRPVAQPILLRRRGHPIPQQNSRVPEPITPSLPGSAE